MHKAHKTNRDFRLEGQSTPLSPTLTEEVEKQRGVVLFVVSFVCILQLREHDFGDFIELAFICKPSHTGCVIRKIWDVCIKANGLIFDERDEGGYAQTGVSTDTYN